ncbi:MAG: hypothetical protein H8E79_03340 [Desulfobulbaceae bacterium]|uniref:Uncharacterized protein n=1 Tax=Candidatus Desulfatifera sulfidica TaxID=2841691 RepID=A0A8J6N5V4_9BACT|nr:hypothetical protein [Candidatus Desulfatifera sulfidica]
MEKKIRLVTFPFGQVVVPVTGRALLRESRWRVWIAGRLYSRIVKKMAVGVVAGLMVLGGVCSFLVQLAEYGW